MVIVTAGMLTGGVLLENREVDSPGADRAVVLQNHSVLAWLTVYESVRLAVDHAQPGLGQHEPRR